MNNSLYAIAMTAGWLATLGAGFAGGALYVMESFMDYETERQIDGRLYEPDRHLDHSLLTETRELNVFLQEIMIFMKEAREDAELQKSLQESRTQPLSEEG